MISHGAGDGLLRSPEGLGGQQRGLGRRCGLQARAGEESSSEPHALLNGVQRVDLYGHCAGCRRGVWRRGGSSASGQRLDLETQALDPRAVLCDEQQVLRDGGLEL